MKLFITLIHLNNTLKFTESGFVEYGYKLNGNYIRFYVKDSGIGIPEKDKSTIFDRYRRGRCRHANKNTEGTGLGLSIIRGLVSLLGGEIWFDSEPDNGSTFYFTIPYKEIEPIVEDIVNLKINMESDWTDKTILVVEDDPVSTELLKEVLSGSGAILEFADNGQSAVDICTSKKIDIVLMDIQLPGMNGQTALYEIKKLNKDIVIIAQTAYAMSGDRENYLLQGFDEYIPKPIYPNILLEMLNKFFDNKK